MKRMIAFVLVVALLPVGAFAQRGTDVSAAKPKPPMLYQGPSPCTDSLYVALKGKPLAELTEREFTYFTQRDDACSKYVVADAGGSPGGGDSEHENVYVTVAVLSLVLGVVIYAVAASSQDDLDATY